MADFAPFARLNSLSSVATSLAQEACIEWDPSDGATIKAANAATVADTKIKASPESLNDNTAPFATSTPKQPGGILIGTGASLPPVEVVRPTPTSPKGATLLPKDLSQWPRHQKEGGHRRIYFTADQQRLRRPLTPYPGYGYAPLGCEDDHADYLDANIATVTIPSVAAPLRHRRHDSHNPEKASCYENGRKADHTSSGTRAAFPDQGAQGRVRWSVAHFQSARDPCEKEGTPLDRKGDKDETSNAAKDCLYTVPQPKAAEAKRGEHRTPSAHDGDVIAQHPSMYQSTRQQRRPVLSMGGMTLVEGQSRNCDTEQGKSVDSQHVDRDNPRSLPKTPLGQDDGDGNPHHRHVQRRAKRRSFSISRIFTSSPTPSDSSSESLASGDSVTRELHTILLEQSLGGTASASSAPLLLAMHRLLYQTSNLLLFLESEKMPHPCEADTSVHAGIGYRFLLYRLPPLFLFLVIASSFIYICFHFPVPPSLYGLMGSMAVGIMAWATFAAQKQEETGDMRREEQRDDLKRQWLRDKLRKRKLRERQTRGDLLSVAQKFLALKRRRSGSILTNGRSGDNDGRATDDIKDPFGPIQDFDHSSWDAHRAARVLRWAKETTESTITPRT